MNPFSVVIPAYNEERGIALVINAIRAELALRDRCCGRRVERRYGERGRKRRLDRAPPSGEWRVREKPDGRYPGGPA